MIATLALFCWPVAALILYRSQPLGSATIWTILGGLLLLPAGPDNVFKLPMIPQFDKASIPTLCALVGCALTAGRLPKMISSRDVIPTVFILAYVIGPFITSELNGDPVSFGHFTIPGVGFYDGISASESTIIALLPFFLGRQFLRGANDTTSILHVLVIAGLMYSIPMWFEIRFSPQLHYWVYGSYPSAFIQEMRADGAFRPMVFVGHGLLAAFFIMSSTVAATALWRTRTRLSALSLPNGAVTGYLSILLTMCKSFGALTYAVILMPLVRFTKPGLQLRVAQLLVIVATAYPMLRTYDLVPTKSILETISSINEARAVSLATRFQNEDLLLQRASERMLFGWGRYGRSRLYTDDGYDYVLSDGRWVITIGQFGMFGFLAEFGLLAICVFRAIAACKVVGSINERIHLAALALILATNIFDLIPNSGLIPWTWLIAGAVLGRSETILATKPSARASQRLNLQSA